MDSHFLQDVFQTAVDLLRKEAGTTRRETLNPSSADVDAALKKAAREVIDQRKAAMERAVRAQTKTLEGLVAEAASGSPPAVDFDFDRITRHASKIASDDPRWKK